ALELEEANEVAEKNVNADADVAMRQK
ncbi:hypothetical protein A2U01_0084711, partial [Trifolium medium]|nr:hypothetical protein [Trifolium medium]